MKPFFDLELVEWDGETPIVERYGDELILDMDDAFNLMEEHGTDELNCYLCVKVRAPQFCAVEVFEGYFTDYIPCKTDLELQRLQDEIQVKINEFCAKHPTWEIGSKRVCVRKED